MSPIGWSGEYHAYRCPRDESDQFGCLCDLINDVTNDARKDVLETLKNNVEFQTSAGFDLANDEEMLRTSTVIALIEELM